MKTESRIEDTLRTPADVAAAGLLSKNIQVREWKEGRLKFYLVGRKVLYSEQHLREYFASCEQNAGLQK